MPYSDAVTTIPTKILVPIDFSESSHNALQSAAELAQRFNAELCLVHVVPTFPTMTVADMVPESQFIEAARAEAERHFVACKSDLQSKGIKVNTCIEESNDVAGAILEAAEESKVNMIAISTHGLSGWYPLVFGSIAEKIVKLAHCPVLLLRTPKPETTAKVPSGRLMEWW